MSPSMSFPSSGRPDRPIPDRTLRQPHRLTVASHDSSSGSNTDAACLRVSFARRAGHQRNAELWADRMMEETLDRATFKQAVRRSMPATPLLLLTRLGRRFTSTLNCSAKSNMNAILTRSARIQSVQTPRRNRSRRVSGW